MFVSAVAIATKAVSRLQVRSEFSLKSHASLDSMVEAINQIIPLAQGTMTGLAIRYTMNVAFTAEDGDRSKVKLVWNASTGYN